MLSFYPEFEASNDSASEVVFLLDLSNSMRGDALRDAMKVLLLCLHKLPDAWHFNVVVFGTSTYQFYLVAQRFIEKHLSEMAIHHCP